MYGVSDPPEIVENPGWIPHTSRPQSAHRAPWAALAADAAVLAVTGVGLGAQ